MMTEKSLEDAFSRLEGIADELRQIQRSQPREYLSVEEAAAFMGLSKIQLDTWRCGTREPGGPAFHRVGRRILYSIADIRSYMAARRQEPLS